MKVREVKLTKPENNKVQANLCHKFEGRERVTVGNHTGGSLMESARSGNIAQSCMWPL